MQVSHAASPVRQPLDCDGAEHRLERAPVTFLHAAADDPLIAGDLPTARLAQGAQRQMIIKQAAQQFPPVNIQMLLKLGVRQAGGVRPIQETDQRLKLPPAGGKRIPAGQLARQVVAASRCGCTFAVSLPAWQDFIARAVKFATTGVEIGGHVGHLRGHVNKSNADFDTLLMTPRPRPTTRSSHAKTPQPPVCARSSRPTGPKPAPTADDRPTTPASP